LSFLDQVIISEIQFARNPAGIVGLALVATFAFYHLGRARLMDGPGGLVILLIVLTSCLELVRYYVTGEDLVWSLQGYLQYVQVAVLYLIFRDTASDKRTIPAMGLAFVFSTTVMSVVANLGLASLTWGGEGQRSGVVGLNINEQAFLYALGVIGVACWILGRWPRLRAFDIGLGVAGGSMILALLQTGSRGGAAVFLFGLGIAFVLFLKRNRLSAYLTVVPMVVLGVSVALMGADVLRTRATATVEEGDTGLRVELARAGSELFAERPLIGWGARYSRTLGEFMQRTKPIAAHNLYLQMLLSFGLLGFIPWLLAVGATLRTAWLSRGSPWGATLLTLLLATLLFGVAGNLAYNKYFWVALALAGRSSVMGDGSARLPARLAATKRPWPPPFDVAVSRNLRPAPGGPPRPSDLPAPGMRRTLANWSRP